MLLPFSRWPCEWMTYQLIVQVPVPSSTLKGQLPRSTLCGMPSVWRVLDIEWASTLFFDCSVADLQCNVNFRCTAQQFSFICIYTYKGKAKSLICVWLFVTPWTEGHQAPLSMGFSRQEYWSGLPFPSPGDLPDPGTEPVSPALQADALLFEPPGKPHIPINLRIYVYACMLSRSSCLTLCDPMNFSLSGSSVHGILQARILEWVSISYVYT